MRRREFIAGSIAVAADKSVLPSSAWAQSAPRINRIIDAHCHVFNAADLPIEGFTKKIMVPKSAQTSELVARFADYPGALEALVHAITVHAVCEGITPRASRLQLGHCVGSAPGKHSPSPPPRPDRLCNARHFATGTGSSAHTSLLHSGDRRSCGPPVARLARGGRFRVCDVLQNCDSTLRGGELEAGERDRSAQARSPSLPSPEWRTPAPPPGGRVAGQHHKSTPAAQSKVRMNGPFRTSSKGRSCRIYRPRRSDLVSFPHYALQFRHR